MDPMLDKEFLLKLDKERNKVIYAKIISLTMNEEPLEEIQGSITSGNINIDGNSSVRRTCSLSLSSKELNIHEFYWGLKTKFKLFIGVENKIDNRYDKIIWFKMGTYVIASFNTSQSINSYTINISGKDKMSMLNGDLGGTIPSLTWDFGTYDFIENDGTVVNQKMLIKEIIHDSVYELGKEPEQNIIIEDLDQYGLNLMEYRGKDPIYLLIDVESTEVRGIELNENRTVYLGATPVALKDANYKSLFSLDEQNANKGTEYSQSPDDDENKVFISKIERGQAAGYKLTGLTFAGDLISNVGETITAMLDKIVQMLGNFEYFYDIDGRFIFRKKPAYVNAEFDRRFTSNAEEDAFMENRDVAAGIQYSFEDGILVSSFGNTPNFGELKNDFVIWGVRKGASGAEIPVHLRYVIDDKPEFYRTSDGEKLYTTHSEYAADDCEVITDMD